jgi:nucleoside phosphorylase
VKVLLVVPKWDEFESVLWGFEADLTDTPEISVCGTRIHTVATVGAGNESTDLCIAFMDSQNNTNAAVATTDAIIRTAPDIVVLTGTALGNPAKTSLCSVIIATAIDDVTERSVLSRSEGQRRLSTIAGSGQSLDVARRRTRDLRRGTVTEWVYSAASELNLMHESDVADFLRENPPSVSDEVIASGNDYFMGGEDTSGELWEVSSKSRAYDMESAGFARSCTAMSVPWLVIRGISDFGVPTSNKDLYRQMPAALAARTASFIIEGMSGRSIGVRGNSLGEQSDPSTLKTLDELPGLTSQIDRITRLDILARTAVNILGGYTRQLEAFLHAGGHFRLVLVDPRSTVAAFLYGNNVDMYRANLASAQGLLRHLAERTSGEGTLAVRLTSDYPPFSFVHHEGPQTASIRLQMNLLHSRIGRDRPVLDVESASRWYSVFLDEFEQIWENSEPTSIEELV